MDIATFRRMTECPPAFSEVRLEDVTTGVSKSCGSRTIRGCDSPGLQ